VVGSVSGMVRNILFSPIQSGCSVVVAGRRSNGIDARQKGRNTLARASLRLIEAGDVDASPAKV
jgi:hypothetical protein